MEHCANQMEIGQIKVGKHHREGAEVEWKVREGEPAEKLGISLPSHTNLSVRC